MSLAKIDKTQNRVHANQFTILSFYSFCYKGWKEFKCTWWNTDCRCLWKAGNSWWNWYSYAHAITIYGNSCKCFLEGNKFVL